MALTREDAAARDEADPLRGFRERFVDTDPERLYLDGNSLGRLPVATRERLAAAVEAWGDRLVSGWPEWIDAPRRVGDLIAEHVVGAAPGAVVVCDSVTVNLYKLVSAVMEVREGALVTGRANFPTDRYVLEGLAARHGRELRICDGPLDTEGAAVVVISHVDYRTGEIEDMAAWERECDAPIVWDLCHSAGAVPVDLRGAGAELAVGCTYKYLNAGPGATAFLYVAAPLQSLRSPIWGWFGQREQFAMERDYDPVPDAGRFLAGTPSILTLAAVEEGVRLTAEAGVPALREKSLAQTALMIELADEWLAPLGFEVASPRDAARRGSHVALRHSAAWPICRALVERAAVVPDFRAPDLIRLASTPLYTSYVEVWEAFDRLRSLVEAGEHERVDAAPARVT